MEKKDIYFANINIVENGGHKVYQGLNPLLSLGDGKYVNLEWIKSKKDYLKLYRLLLTGNDKTDIVIHDDSSEADIQEGIYVDSKTVIPYYNKDNNQKISVKKVKRDILLDPRIPRGIDYGYDGTMRRYIRMPNPRKKQK